MPALRTRTAVLAASVLLTILGVLPVASLAVFVWLIAALAVLDVVALRLHARRLRRHAPGFRRGEPEMRHGEVISLGIDGVARVLDLRDAVVDSVAAGERRARLAGPVLGSLQEAYPLGDWHDWHRAPSAGAYPTYHVRTDRGEYALQVSHARSSAAAVAFEIRLLDHLADRAFPAPRVIPTLTGEPWHHEGGLYVVTERLSGTPYDPANPAHLSGAGQALAAYHEAVTAFPERLRSESRPVLAGLEKNGPALLAAFADMVGPLLGEEDRARLSRSSSYLWNQFIRVPEALSGVVAACPRLVVHGSYRPEALHFEGESLSGVAGFSRSGYDLRALDLADALWAFAGDGPALDFDRVSRFLAAYGEVSPAEAEALPWVLRLRRLVTVFATLTSCLDSPLLLLPGEGEGFAGLVDLLEAEAERLRWLDDHDAGLDEALGVYRVS